MSQDFSAATSACCGNMTPSADVEEQDLNFRAAHEHKSEGVDTQVLLSALGQRVQGAIGANWLLSSPSE